MAVQVYKMEVGTTLGPFNRDWTFYWQVGNQSGRSGVEICGDLAQQLAVDSVWFSFLRELWGHEQSCRLFRIRRVWPNIESWVDFYWRFRHLRGHLGSQVGSYSQRVRVMWFTDRWEVRSPCSYFDVLAEYPIVENKFPPVQLQIVRGWASQHALMYTTAFGDQFRAAILDRFGNYSPIISYTVDQRPVASRRHLWKG